jgi:hypothetical protein
VPRRCSVTWLPPVHRRSVGFAPRASQRRSGSCLYRIARICPWIARIITNGPRIRDEFNGVCGFFEVFLQASLITRTAPVQTSPGPKEAESASSVL